MTKDHVDGDQQSVCGHFQHVLDQHLQGHTKILQQCCYTIKVPIHGLHEYAEEFATKYLMKNG